MCFFGGGGGGAPQIVYRDVPKQDNVIAPPLPAPPPPTRMSEGVAPADQFMEADSTKNNRGTSIFRINRDEPMTNDYQDQGLDSGISYQG